MGCTNMQKDVACFCLYTVTYRPTTNMAGILAFLAVIMTECQDIVIGLTCNIGLDFRTEDEFAANILKPCYALNKL